MKGSLSSTGIATATFSSVIASSSIKIGSALAGKGLFVGDAVGAAVKIVSTVAGKRLFVGDAVGADVGLVEGGHATLMVTVAVAEYVVVESKMV